MIGFWLVNLLPPEDPLGFDLRTPAGVWKVNQSSAFKQLEPDIRGRGFCGNTYSMEFQLPRDATRSSVKDAAFSEVLPICLAMAYVTGAAVTIRNSLSPSEIAFAQVGPHFPRMRGIPDPSACVATLKQFTDFVEAYITQYSRLNSTEKFLLLTHFYIDALSCWSLENLYLSASTLLQVIASTEEDTGRQFAAIHAARRTGKSKAKPAFFDYLAGAADRVGIAPPSHDVVRIRNSLIHEGTLKSNNFPAQVDATVPIAEAMSWVDNYVYAVLKLGNVPVPRQSARDLAIGLNSFSYE
jgi:hypothetical protein